MARDRRHFTLRIGKARPFAAKTGGSSKNPSDVNYREAHAQALLTALDHLPNIAENNLPGVYLAIEGRPIEVMITKSLNANGLTLLKVEKQPGASAEATVFATEKGLRNFARRSQILVAISRSTSAEASSRRRTPTWCKALVRFLRLGFAPYGAVLEAGFRPNPTSRPGKCGSGRWMRPPS